MSDAEQRELYLLRRHFGISAHQARHVIPEWEIELLLNQFALEQYGHSIDDDVPDALPDEGVDAFAALPRYRGEV